MNGPLSVIQRVLGIGLVWGLLWIAVATAVGMIIGLTDPQSIGPGEGPVALMVLGPMGFFSGIAFAILLVLAERGRNLFGLNIYRTALWGILGSAIVQLGYLNHGDAGLIENLQVALVFCGFGALIAPTWLFLARRWWSWLHTTRR